MRILERLRERYDEARANKWFRYFTVFCRVALAAGFIPPGFVKVMGERFTGLPSNHPLGHYFDALYLTGYYYTFLGVVQLTIALLLLIPRTALLGALLYFPVIVNICVLAYAVRFEGTRITTMMLLANLYLLCWDYDRLKSLLPLKRSTASVPAVNRKISNRFPFVFFAGVVLAVALVIFINKHLFDIRPGNSAIECTNGCGNNEACLNFCNCIYNEGKPLDTCLAQYEKAKLSMRK